MKKIVFGTAVIMLLLTVIGCTATDSAGIDTFGNDPTVIETDVADGSDAPDSETELLSTETFASDTETEFDEITSIKTETEPSEIESETESVTETEHAATEEITPETTKAQESTKVPETTQTPTTTKAPETTIQPSETKGPESSHTHKWHDYSYDYGMGLDIEPGVRCSVCNVWKCDVEGHAWVEATCESPKYCPNCGTKGSDPLGHKYVEGECSRCGDIDFTSEILLNRLGERIAYYINQFRTDQGTDTMEAIPGLTEIGMYRAGQITKNFSHDPDDQEEAFDNSQYGDQYRDWAHEAIGINSGSKYVDELAYSIALQVKNSESHWSYVGDSYHKYIGVGIAQSGALCYFCIMVCPFNYG